MADICLTNKTAIVDMISKLQADLSEFATLMEQQDGDGLYERMSRAKQARDSYMAYLENGKPA